jgi:predicted ester cyclase
MAALEELNKSVVQRFGEAQQARKLDLLDELVAPDFVRHCQATPWVEIRGLDEFKRLIQEDRAAVPDGRVTPRFLIAEGDYVAMYCTYTSTHTGQWGPIPPTDKRFELDISGVIRLASGKIAELWITWDNLAVLTQLGRWPPA